MDMKSHALRHPPEFDHVLLVALTGYGTEEDRRRSFEAGFDEHMVKPASAKARAGIVRPPQTGGRFHKLTPSGRCVIEGWITAASFMQSGRFKTPRLDTIFFGCELYPVRSRLACIMELRKVVSLWGPNIWAPCPMLEAWVELERIGRPSVVTCRRFNSAGGMAGRLAGSVGRPGWRRRACPARRAPGCRWSELLALADVAVAAAASGRAALRRGFAQATGNPGHYRVAVEFEEESLARLALTSAAQNVPGRWRAGRL